MENVKIFVDGIQKDVYGLLYVYNSKYYFIYTEKEIDENGYVILYMSQVGKETKNTETGPIDTGYMIGVEASNPEEQQAVQTSITYIVEDKKNNTVNPRIQYLPMSMLTNLKIISKKRFRLLKSIVVDNFKVPFNDAQVQSENLISVLEPITVLPTTPISTQNPEILNSSEQSITPIANVGAVSSIDSVQPMPLQNLNNNKIQSQANVDVKNEVSSTDGSVIIDYRSKYFEEEEKNKELQTQIDELIQKLNEIKKVVE